MTAVVDTVIQFANSAGEPQVVVDLFSEIWPSVKKPSKATSTSAHVELHKWLNHCAAGGGTDTDFIEAMMGIRRKEGKPIRGERRVEFRLTPGFSIRKEGRKVIRELTHACHIVGGSLSAVCGYAVAHLCAQNLRIARCKRRAYARLPSTSMRG